MNGLDLCNLDSLLINAFILPQTYTYSVTVIDFCHENNYRENEIRFQICFSCSIFAERGGDLFVSFLLCHKENWDKKELEKKVGLIKRKTNGKKSPIFRERQI